MRSCGSGADSWAAWQWNYITGKHPEMYSSQNAYLHAKALASWLAKSGLLPEFKKLVEEVCLFDDPRLNNTSVVHTVHAWGLAVQAFKQMPADVRQVIFLEGVPFMMPSLGSATASDSCASGREARCS